MQHHGSLLTGLIILAAIICLMIFSTLYARRKGYTGIGGHTIVRCRSGHLFTTIWLPGASLKSIRLGFARFQYCPVGKHWTLVVPVKESELTDQEKRLAAKYRDSRIP